ncbi:hypothetical protein Tco_0124838, partial [Tanacetum coccineum]
LNTTAGNPVKKILLKLNLSDHMSILTDPKVSPTNPGRMTKPYSSLCFIANYFRYSDTTHLSRSIKVLKLKNFKKDATLKLFKNGNTDQLEDFEEFNGGSVTFGGSKGYYRSKTKDL